MKSLEFDLQIFNKCSTCGMAFGRATTLKEQLIVYSVRCSHLRSRPVERLKVSDLVAFSPRTTDEVRTSNDRELDACRRSISDSFTANQQMNAFRMTTLKTIVQLR